LAKGNGDNKDGWRLKVEAKVKEILNLNLSLNLSFLDLSHNIISPLPKLNP